MSTTSQSCIVEFLDDKLQTSTDLLSLGAQLLHVSEQQTLLNDQLQSARCRLDDARQQADSHYKDITERALVFRQTQADIDQRLLVITASKTSDEAVPRFEAVLETLHRLEIASGYLNLLVEVRRLIDEAYARLGASDEAVLQLYKQLCVLHHSLITLQKEAEGAAPQLLHHVGTAVQALRNSILGAFSASLDAVLTKIHWPKANADIPAHLQDEWNLAVARLLHLQMPELEAIQDRRSAGDKLGLPIVLFPLERLVQPLEARFHYHFDGDRPTNRIDRPEYFLSHITTLLNDHSGFVDTHIQPILLKHFHGTDLWLDAAYMDATSAFITALLPMLRTKIASLLPKVAAQPQLLSHLMHEIMTFDTTIRDKWGYNGGLGAEGWKGLSWEVLVHGDWFGRWLEVEKNFALSRYQSIVNAPDFGELDFESVDSKATKPTKGAIRVNDLLETITDRYRPLASYSQKLTFLIEIQIAIFDKLHAKLGANLDAYLTKTTSLGRAMGGVTKAEQEKLLGVEGLEQVCKTYGSADYLERAMRDWSDDVFFLDIWEWLQDRAQQTKSIGSMSVADVAERTSKAVEGEGDGGSLFDETASWYAALRQKSEKIITDTLNNNARDALYPYRHVNPWATLRPVALSSPLSPTAEIDALLTYLDRTLSFLARALASASLRRIVRSVLGTISGTIWDHVLSRYRFSAAGAAQLRADIEAVCFVVNKSVGEGVAESGMRRCYEGCRLVGLPVVGSKEDVRIDDEDGEDWGAWEDQAADGELVQNKAEVSDQPLAAESPLSSETAGVGLWEVEKRVFADNQSARDVLDALGLEVLNEMEARMLLRQRVELSE